MSNLANAYLDFARSYYGNTNEYQNLERGHLAVEEPDDGSQLVSNSICEKDQANLLSPQTGFDQLPEFRFRLFPSQEF